MIDTQISQDARRRARRRVSPEEAMQKVNAALRRLVKNYEREFEAIVRAEGMPRESSLGLGEVELEGFQYLLLRVPSAPLQFLTDRQREIALSVAEGLSNKDVANRLAIRPATVAAHLREIYKKMKVHSRSGLLLRIIATQS